MIENGESTSVAKPSTESDQAHSVQVGGRIVDQLALALEQVGAGVDRLDFVLRDACATAVTLFTLLNRDFRFVCSTWNP